jgi:hypothetical protein
MGAEVLLPGDLQRALSVGLQTQPSLAAGPAGTSLAVWSDTRSGGNPAVYVGVGLGTMSDIYAARIDASGNLLDATPLPIATTPYNQTAPKVAFNGSNWLIAWQAERADNRYESDIYAVRVDASGTILDPQPIVVGTHLADPASSNDIDPSGPLQVVSDGAEWVVGWRHHNPALVGGIGMEWFGARVRADGTLPNAQGVNYFTADQYAKDFGLTFAPIAGGQYLHAFVDSSGSLTIRRFDRSLNLIAGSQHSLNVGNSVTRVAAAGGPVGWTLSYVEDSGSWANVKALRIGSSGTFIDTTPIAVTPLSAQSDLSNDIAWDGTNWAISYSDYGSAGTLDHDIFLRRLRPSGSAATSLLPATKVINTSADQIRPTLISSGDGAVEVLYEDYLSGKPGIAVGMISATNQLLAQRDVSIAAPSQGASEIASDGTNLLAVYSSSTAYGTRLLATRMDAAGHALDAQPIVLADANMSPGPYEVVYLGGRYVATFNATSGSQGNQIYARTISSGGVVGPVVALMPTAPFTGFSLSDASVLGGRMILVGNSNEGNPQFSIRFGRVFDANLTAVTGRFTIGAGFALSGDTEPVGGRWLTAWAWKSTHDTPRAGITYSFVSPDGTVSPQIFLTDTYPDNGIPTVVSNGGAAATEAMIVFRQSRHALAPQINNEDALRAQRIAADGTRIGSVFTLIDQPQLQDQVRGVFDGTNYVLSWTDQRYSPYPAQSQDDVFAARVRPDGTVLDVGGFPVASSSRPEYASSLGVAGQRVLFMYRSFRSEAPLASYRLAARPMALSSPQPRLLIPIHRWGDEVDQLGRSAVRSLAGLPSDGDLARELVSLPGSSDRLVDQITL